MKSRRQRVWLTAMAVAGSVALYGCGGGSDGPDTTPFDQDYVDDAVDEAKKAEEERQAAIAAATEAANEAATAASDAATAERDAAAAAAAATIAATYETLDADEAEAQSTAAANAKVVADTALTAANDALAKANAVDHTDQAVTDLTTAARSSASAADLSAKAAAGFATEAKTQADIARAIQTGIDNDRLAAQEQGEQRRIAANKAGDAAEAAKTAAEKATEAKDARTAEVAAVAAVPAAKQALDDATATKTAVDADTNSTQEQKDAAQKAVDDAQKAYDDALKTEADYNTRATTASEAAAAAEAARDAAKMASEEAAAAALAAGDTDSESEGAKSAAEAEASYLAVRISANVARGWSDVVAITKTYKDTDATEASLDDLLARIPWATDQDRAAGALSVLLARAHDAAEGLAEQEDPDSGGTKAYQEDISRDLTAVTTDATNIAEALSAARAAHNAAKPWSENGRAVDNATGAEGETLATGAILINEDGRINLGGNGSDDPDTPENERLNVVADVTSPASDWGPHDVKLDLGIASFSGNYHLSQYNRWGTGPGEVYDYISFGSWASDDDPFTAPGLGNNSGIFVFVRDGAPATAADAIGTASFTGNHFTQLRDLRNPNVASEHPGSAKAKVDFANDTAELDIYIPSVSGGPWYSVKNINLNGNVLSGGAFSHPSGNIFPIFLNRNDTTSTIHAGVFGEKAEEIAGTIRAEGARTGAPSRRATMTTVFGLRNDEYR